MRGAKRVTYRHPVVSWPSNAADVCIPNAGEALSWGNGELALDLRSVCDVGLVVVVLWRRVS